MTEDHPGPGAIPPGPSSSRASRSTWTDLTDAQLLAQCAVDTYRASGPGGQKRNKTSSAVRLRHGPTGLLVIAEESRSQYENKAKALGRLRRSLYLHVRDPLPAALATGSRPAEWVAAAPAGRLTLRPKDPRFWPAAGIALDVLTLTAGQVSTAAELLGISTAHLVEFLAADPTLWQEANRVRVECGHRPLKPT